MNYNIFIFAFRKFIRQVISMDTVNEAPEKSSIAELLSRFENEGDKSLEYICSQIGEPQRIYAGDPLRCRRDSLSCVWDIDGSKVTMYFDPKKICFGIEIDRVMLPLGSGSHTNRRTVKFLKNFIKFS